MAYNDIYVDSMSRAYSRFLQSQLAGTKTKGIAGFREMVKSADGNAGAAEAGQVPKEEMTLEEYKQYIHQKISQIPMHPSQAMGAVAVHITDEGFEAMRKDPEYEKWVLDTLRSNFSFNDPWASVCGGRFSVHRFGATKEEYRGEGWSMGFNGGKGSALFDDEAEESFWEKRAKRHKKMIELQQDAAKEEKIMGRVLKEAAVRRGDRKGMFAEESLAQYINLSQLLLNPEVSKV